MTTATDSVARRLPGARSTTSSPTTPSWPATPTRPWFATGEATRGEVRHLTVQFSVFSHLFVEAQLRKVINAADLDTYRAGKEILLNELGVVFNAGRARRRRPAPTPTSWPPRARSTAAGSASAPPTSSGCCASPPRSASGSTTSASAATAPPSTLFFCDELLEVYGAEDASVAEGASYAVEHWAAAGFWKELIAGLEAFKARECDRLPLAFWTWHDKVEDQHAAHTDDELVEAYAQPWFDEERFLAGAARDARRRAGVLGRAVGRPRGGGRAVTAAPVRAPTLGGIDHLEWWVGNARAFAGFLAVGLRLRPGRLRRPRDRPPRPRQLPARAGPGPLHGVRRARTPTARSPPTSAPTATASATSASSSTTSPRPTTPRSPRGADLAARAGQGRGRPRRRPPRRHPRLRRHRAHVPRPRRPTRVRSRRSSSRPTSSARSVPTVGITRFDHVVANVEQGHLERLGRPTTATCSASTSSPTSTTSRSPPSTRR